MKDNLDQDSAMEVLLRYQCPCSGQPKEGWLNARCSYEAKEGDEIILVIDESNILIDLHKKGMAPAGHRLIAGKLTYADPFWEVIEIINAEGKQTFAVDDAAGSRLSVLKEGKLVRAELDEDNMVVDIHPTH